MTLGHFLQNEQASMREILLTAANPMLNSKMYTKTLFFLSLLVSVTRSSFYPSING